MPLWKNHVMSLWVKWVLSLVWQKALQLDLSYLTVFISVLLCTLLSHCTVWFWACPDPSDSHQNHSFCYDKLSFNHHDKKPTKAICTMEQGVCTKTPRLTWTSLCNYFLPSCYFLHMWFYLFIVVPYLSLKLKPPEHRIYPSTFLAYFCWCHNINSKQIVISISIPVCFCKLGVCVVVLGWITLIELTVFTCTGS